MMHGTMEIGSLKRSASGPMINHGRRSERGSGIVQIYQILAVNLLFQLRKLLSQPYDIHIGNVYFQRAQNYEENGNIIINLFIFAPFRTNAL